MFISERLLWEGLLLNLDVLGETKSQPAAGTEDHFPRRIGGLSDIVGRGIHSCDSLFPGSALAEQAGGQDRDLLVSGIETYQGNT